MKIKDIFAYLSKEIYAGRENIEIGKLCYNSKLAEKNDLFVALKGSKTNGHQFIPELIKKGAYIVAEKSSGIEDHRQIFKVDDTRLALAFLSKAFFNNPAKDLYIVGITGTNGKTTTTYMIKAILDEAGIKTGIIGTIQYLIGDEVRKAENTTPESFEIYKMLSEIKEKGCHALAIEISSHSIAMNRIAGLDLDTAIFTNITQDHLDYHKTMEDYFNTKLLVFKLLKESEKPRKLAILNSDIPEFSILEKTVKELGLDYQSYGLKNKPDWKAQSVTMNIYHNIFSITGRGMDFTIDTPMLGEFNMSNALCAVAASVFKGANKSTIEQGLKKVSVNGRFERILSRLGFAVLIDYAHTPDALENILKAGKLLSPINIITVFGAGGDRDKTKRPKMGAIARQHSNYSILTSDNPRSEEPMAILKEIESAFEGCQNYEIIENREEAIKKSIHMAEEGDLVIIAGKGHEDYQIFKDRTIRFSDHETAERYIKERETAASPSLKS